MTHLGRSRSPAVIAVVYIVFRGYDKQVGVSSALIYIYVRIVTFPDGRVVYESPLQTAGKINYKVNS